jgi:(1->4)-alpha-D-glucan 1-alpha-D-glucosylmutase
MLYSLLDQLSRQCGIGDAYHNWRGELMWVSRETKAALLEAMGCPTDDAAAIENLLHELDLARWRTLLPPVAVQHPGRHTVTVAVAAEELDRPLDWHVRLEGSGEWRGRARAGDLEELERRDLDGRWQTRRVLPLPEGLPHGYHSLRVCVEHGACADSALIVAPRGCFEPQLLRDGRRLWGVAIQLYTLRSNGNWGIGDFADLEAVVRGCAPYGAAYVGLNPLHALFPSNAWHFSPYSPSSRHFLNVLYIAVERLPEFAECAEARRHVAVPEFQAELERLRATPNVDYPGVANAKLPVLELLFAHFRREHLARGSARAAAGRAPPAAACPHRASLRETPRRHRTRRGRSPPSRRWTAPASCTRCSRRARWLRP